MRWESTLPTFSARLEWVLDGRPPYPWGSAIGLSQGTVRTMTLDAGIPPKQEGLLRIMRSENVSLRWLLAGQGQPFMASVYTQDAHAAEDLEDLFSGTGEPWRMLILDCGDRWALGVHRPESVTDSKGEFQFMRLEVLTGALGEACLGLLREQRKPLWRATISYDEFCALERGHLGTWKVVGVGNPQSLFRRAMAQDSPFGLAGLGKQRAATGVQEGRAAYGDEEALLVSGWRTLSEEERKIMRHFLAPLFQQGSRDQD